MKRIRLFEFHDKSWCPRLIRSEITNILQFSTERRNTFKHVIPKLIATLDLCKSKHIVDLCSGGGGPWLKLYEHEKISKIYLTDKYPNTIAMQRIKNMKIKK